MTKVAITEQHLTNIANAIRSKSGSSDTYTPAEMATAITNIPSGGGGTEFVITLTYDSQDEIWKPDCTFAQVSAAYIAGKTISAKTDDLYCAADIWADGSDYFVGEVVWFDEDEGKLAIDGYTWDANGGWVLDARDYVFTPFLETTTRTYTPSATTQTETITPSQGYDGIEEVSVTVNAVQDVSNYVYVDLDEDEYGFITEGGIRKFQVLPYMTLSGRSGWVNGTSPYTGNHYKWLAVPANTTITPSTQAQTIGGANYMMEGAVTVSAMPTGTAGTPTATKGTVSNHAVSVTPSVTNTTGYITGSTKTGTAVTVSASELVSGSETKTANGTYDVTNLAELVVNVSGGGGSPKKFVMRPDAELVQTYSADYLAVADKGVTLPSYNTSNQTVVASANLSPTVSIDFTNYDYFVTMRGLAIPQYSTTTKQKGRCDYLATSYVYELLVSPANDAHSIDGTKSYVSRSAVFVPHGSAGRECYWTSSTAIGIGNSASYGTYVTGTAPAISGSTVTIKSPVCGIRGHTSYMTSGAWSTMTDIRYQWIIEVWKAPITEVAGWEYTSTIRSIFADVRNGGDLT